MCGTPYPTDVLGGVVPVRFTLGLEERYLSKSNALDEGPGREQEREHRLGVFALWRPQDRLALLGRLPYAVKELTERPQGEAAATRTARGLGDAELVALVALLRRPGPHATTVALVLAGAAPTGSNVLRDGSGARLDAHLQPGTGAWSGTGGLNAAVEIGAGVWEASLLGRVNGTSAHGYRYGDAALYNAGFTSRPWKGWQLLAQLNGRTAARDRLEDGAVGVNTGGTVLYAAPGARWQTDLGLTIDAAVQLPVLESLDGDQREHTTARLSLSLNR
jgi:hypothetical protein